MSIRTPSLALCIPSGDYLTTTIMPRKNAIARGLQEGGFVKRALVGKTYFDGTLDGPTRRDFGPLRCSAAGVLHRPVHVQVAAFFESQLVSASPGCKVHPSGLAMRFGRRTSMLASGARRLSGVFRRDLATQASEVGHRHIGFAQLALSKACCCGQLCILERVLGAGGGLWGRSSKHCAAFESGFDRSRIVNDGTRNRFL